ncbi:hypothetical protein [Paraburkholderia sp. BL9I2N2]|uniref:hypothetical protein n=1 Tax=Paraburkholderia sp. BL9I2N2 TaxID=1938809 RepID=UPI001A9D7F88|nr:hypothetical protein [Paraburkholderia sp. BL9I2N2]
MSAATNAASEVAEAAEQAVEKAAKPAKPAKQKFEKPVPMVATTRMEVLASMETSQAVKSAGRGRKSKSPYTPQNVDIAIDHLERVVLEKQSESLFPRACLLERIIQAFPTPGLNPVQQQRLERLLERISASVP